MLNLMCNIISVKIYVLATVYKLPGEENGIIQDYRGIYHREEPLVRYL